MPRVAQGGVVTLRGNVGRVNGYPADPDVGAALTLTILAPTGATVAGFPVTTPAIERDALGQYHYDWTVPALLAIDDYTATWATLVDGAAAGGSETVEVVAPGTITMLPAYATLADFADTYEIPPGSARAGRIEAVLAEASALLEGVVGWDFYRHSAGSGTEQRVFDGTGDMVIHVHHGIVSLATVEMAWGPDLTYTALTAADWYLAASRPDLLEPQPGEGHAHVVLSDLTGYRFPYGQRRVRLTGTFGYATVPTRVKRGAVALARQIYRADATTPGGMAGPDEWGGGSVPRGWPDDAWRGVVQFYRELYSSCYV